MNRMKSKNLYIGIDIGGTTSALAVMSNDGIIVEREQYATIIGENAWEHSYDQMKKVIVKFLTKYKIASIGISCGGPLDSKEGIILSPPNLPGWDEVKIVQTLKNEFGILTYLENDANAGALAEWKFGAGKGKRNLIFLTFGTGLGAGIILDGELYSGANNFGGEVGHIRLAEDGPIGYHKRGSFEGFCSGTGLSQMMALELLYLTEEIGKAQMMKKYKEPGEITGRDVVEWAKRGDVLALKVVEKSGEYLGKGLSILIDILNPELIIIGSMGVRLGNLLLDPARKIVEKEALFQAAKLCKIVSAAQGEKVGDLAALCVALKVEEN
jgi:glucokinase